MTLALRLVSLVFWLTLKRSMNNLGKLGYSTSVRGDKGATDLDVFRKSAEDLTPLLEEEDYHPHWWYAFLSVCRKKKPTTASLDGWGLERV